MSSIVRHLHRREVIVRYGRHAVLKQVHSESACNRPFRNEKPTITTLSSDGDMVIPEDVGGCKEFVLIHHVIGNSAPAPTVR